MDGLAQPSHALFALLIVGARPKSGLTFNTLVRALLGTADLLKP